MNVPWDPAGPGVLRLPSGRLVRGRGLRRHAPAAPDPTFAVYLLGRPPPPVAWESHWLRWPDFGLPADHDALTFALTQAWRRTATDRVEIGCAGGHGRTGTALACLAILDGLPGSGAIAFIREHYDQDAVETRKQEDYVARFGG